MSETHEGGGSCAAVAAGDFDTWLADIQASLRRGSGVDVPCGDCRGCCTSGHFVPIGADERDALAAVPKAHQVPAPGLPPGHAVIGFDADGHCAMFAANRCSVYERRPRACRSFDCRVLAAADQREEGRWAERINARVDAWRFRYSSPQSEERHGSIVRAAAFVRANTALFPGGRAPTRGLDIAVLAIKVHAVFALSQPARSAEALAMAIVEASRRFDAGLAPDGDT